MKILQICLKPPVPELDGGCKAINSLTQGFLAHNFEVKVLTLSTPKHPFQPKAISEEYQTKTKIEHTFVNTEVTIYGAFINLFSCKSYNIERFYSKNFEELIKKNLQQNQYDIVILESLYVTKYSSIIRENTTAKVIYRAHNIEYEIWENNAKQEKGIKKSYLILLAKRLKQFEKKIINQFDGIAAITENDHQKLIQMGCRIPIEVFPFGIDVKKYEITSHPKSISIFHIGSMDWSPNEVGIKWFLDNVWNLISNQFPEVKLNLAGKNMPKWLLEHRQKNVIINGEVADAIDFMHQNTIMIVPLFVGSGMRIKIIEAMALGKVIIATTIAAEGISYKVNENIIIANTANEFIAAITNCLTNDIWCKKLEINANKMVATNYDNKVIVNKLVQFFKHINS